MLWDANASVAENASRVLPKIARKFVLAGRIAVRPRSSWKDLHRFRLISKRFRYSLEIFQHCYGPGIERRIETMRRIQTVLGDINDCDATLGLDGIAEEPAFAEWLKNERTRQLQTFREVWRQEFGMSHAARNWSRYLRTPRTGIRV
jgi:CHAD domain-containing protein